MSPTALWGLTLLIAVGGIFVAMMSALLERSGLIRLRHWAEEAGGRLERTYQRKRRFETYRMLLGLVSRLAPVGAAITSYRASTSILIGLLTAAVMVLVSEIASRALVARSSEESLRRLTGAYGVTLLLLGPLITLLRPAFPQRALEPRDDLVDEASEGEIAEYISVGQREGILEPGEELLVKGVVEFGDTLVKSAMTPRIDMVAAPLQSPPAELLDIFLNSGHSRLPLYRASEDQIVSVLHLRDLVSAMRADGEVQLSSISMPAYIVPETKPVAELLREFQASHQQLAIAVDEFGGTAGVVTVEDLLEEIVGDIADEHEDTDTDRLRVSRDIWLLSGSCDVEELGDLFDIDLGETSYETVGGLVFNTLGYLPRAGETVQRHGLEFEVVEVGDRRVQRVRVQPVEGGIDEA